MKKQQLEKLFDEKFSFLDNKSADELKQFIFDTVIPEVMKDITNVKYENSIIGDYQSGYGDCLLDIKKRAKDLFGITL